MKSHEKFVKHNLDAGQLNHRLSGLRQILVVDGEPSEVLQLGKGSFDNPSFRKDLEFAGAFIGAKHDFNNPTELLYEVTYVLLKYVFESIFKRFLHKNRLNPIKE